MIDPNPSQDASRSTSLWSRLPAQNYYGAGIMIGLLAGVAATLFHFLSDRIRRHPVPLGEIPCPAVQLPLVVLNADCWLVPHRPGATTLPGERHWEA